MNRLRILILSPTVPPQVTGNAVTAERWCTCLRELGHQVSLTTPEALDPEGAAGIQVIHAHHLFKTGAAALTVAETLGVPLVVSVAGTDMKLVHLEDIGPHYAETLRCWRERFLEHRSRVLELGYPESLTRMWDYYLAYCEAGFEERYIGDVQMLLYKPGCREMPPLPALDREVRS